MMDNNTTNTQQAENINSGKAFKHNGDISNFYQYVRDNNLVHEAAMLMKVLHDSRNKPVAKRGRKSKKTLQ